MRQPVGDTQDGPNQVLPAYQIATRSNTTGGVGEVLNQELGVKKRSRKGIKSYRRHQSREPFYLYYRKKEVEKTRGRKENKSESSHQKEEKVFPKKKKKKKTAGQSHIPEVAKELTVVGRSKKKGDETRTAS